ncbi:helix-turn-helix transcriptional regulator [Thomasclavelia cocleata]|uniref:helix-turn-helix transcriptional regulator n=1 Tax=Thomasclavelia cocleata TaxID=69824 RepID=UPI00272EC33B|nr:YafY family protein [Thomasclavelia cocleata]
MQVNNRLFEIVYILMQKKKTTAKELADRFEVSTRTIYRDIETLSGANIPIYASKGKDGGIGLLDEYVLNKTILSEEEQNQILFALQGMKKVKAQDEKDILEKLSILFNKKINDWIKIDFSNWGNIQEERFDIIKSAILNKQLVQFIYYNSNGEENNRIVEPLQIWFKDKSWYLISYCKLKEDYRIFKIARIKEIKILEEHFERELPKEEEKEKHNFKMIELELEINKAMTYRVYDEFESKEITKKEDGNFIIKVKYPENEWIYGYILSFGEYAKILNPAYVKNIIKDKLQKTLKNYL